MKDETRRIQFAALSPSITACPGYACVARNEPSCRSQGKGVARASLFVILFFCGPLYAGENSGSASSDDLPTGLQTLDWIFIAGYALTTLAIGFYYSRQQQTTKEYFVGGGNLNSLLVGVSLFATLLSTISYLSMPGEAAGKGPALMLSVLGFPLIYLVVGFVLLPVYMRQRVTSAYELLEKKLGLSIRLLGASMFLALRLVWMTLLIYLAAKAMVIMMGLGRSIPIALGSWQTGLEVDSISVVVMLSGLISIIYTSMGGLRAVVVTDFMQTVLLFGGALLVLLTVTLDFGGFGWVPTEWQSSWDTQPLFSTDPKTRVTVVGTVLSVLVWYVATLGGDQTTVQRFMATRDASAARQAVATQLIVGTIVQTTLVLVGFSLLAYFALHRDLLPAHMDLKKDADDLFPRYISYHLPVGVSGLVVAAMFAAAMSSIDSGVNSITAVVTNDFLDRLGMKPATEKGEVRVARFLALGIGLIVILGSSFMKYIEGNITAVTQKTVNLLTVPIFGLFFFALFVRRANAAGVWIGTIAGTLTAAAIAFSGPLVYALHVLFGVDPALFNSQVITATDKVTGEQWQTCEDAITFQWIGPTALVVDITVGWIACQLFAPRGTDSQEQVS